MILLAMGAVLVLAGLLAGCAYGLWLLAAPPQSIQARRPRSRPPVLIVVPVFDEAPLIARKLRNLAALHYSAARRHVVIVDGGSTDGTIQSVAAWIAGRPGFELLQTSHRNKAAQINEAVGAFPEASWILVTDADAMLGPDTLLKLVDVAARSASVGVVGTRVRPASAHFLEALHWRLTDWLREREARRGTAGIVAAPCYLVERQFVADLPLDVLADDVHVACRAMLAGKRVGHAEAVVLELRSPRRFTDLLRHKYRKADAYLREVFRFLPRAGEIPLPMRRVFQWRAGLLTFLPAVALTGGVLTLTAIGRTPLLPPPGATVTVSLAIAALAVTRVGRDTARLCALSLVLLGVTVAALVRYPISRQAASFPKILQPWEYQLPEEPQ